MNFFNIVNSHLFITKFRLHRNCVDSNAHFAADCRSKFYCTFRKSFAGKLKVGWSDVFKEVWNEAEEKGGRGSLVIIRGRGEGGGGEKHSSHT